MIAEIAVLREHTGDTGACTEVGLAVVARGSKRVAKSNFLVMVSLYSPIYLIHVSDQSATTIPNLQQREEQRVNKTTLASHLLKQALGE